MSIFYAIIVVTVGSCLGSFINVLIYRLPRGIGFVKGTSFCPECKQRIMPWDLIPLVSYFLLRGKCRRCGHKISIRYPVIEMAGGALGLFAVLRYGFQFEGFLYLLFFLILLAVAVIDGEYMIIPNGLVIALAVLAIPLVIFYGAELTLLSRVNGLLVLSLPMFIFNLFIKDAFGGGDIKLMAVCGFLLGFGSVLAAGFIGIISAGMRALVLVLSGKPYKNVRMPFGPYLCMGTFMAALAGEQMVNWYLGYAVF